MPGLIRFRWIAIFCLMLGIYPLLQWGFLKGESLPYVAAVLLLLAVFNTASQRMNPKDETAKNKFILIQLWVDLFAAVGILFVSGSANNPFVSILCIHAFLGGMLLRNKSMYGFGASIWFLLILLQYETYLANIRAAEAVTLTMFLSFLSQWVLITASFFVSQYFSKILARNEERIRSLQARQHQADRLKSLGALTAGFSHQMATPLNSLTLRMERGLRKISGDALAAKEELEKAQVSLNECVHVFQHMASVFSRSSQAELEIVNLGESLTELLKVWQKEHPGIFLETDLPRETLIARLQLLAFSHSFFDLLDNAAEASNGELPIRVSLYLDSSWIVLKVQDQGTGISDEMISRLGEPFATTKLDGNGLGLYSVNLMAQASGGEFRIFNNSDRPGVTAEIRLPKEDERV